ncbi:MAG: NAD(P)-dependent oxidoreductase [Actinomycetota bacterium]
MKLYVTGSTGFVGSHVVAAATARGHDVAAVVRPARSTVPEPAEQRTGDGPVGSVDPVRVDLRSRRGLAESLDGADAVIHLAAAKAGDFATQFAGTVMATENLLGAMTEAGVGRLVAISTFSVYDYLNTRPGTLIDEQAPIDRSPALRDEYAQTKLLQEELYREFGASADTRLVILRPGMIYGEHNLWHALLGAEFGPRFLRIGNSATLPLTYVENCAEAMVLAAERLGEPDDPIDGEVINLVDDDLPTQRTYADLVAAAVETPPSIPIPWPVIRTAAGALKAGNQALLGGRAKFPGIAVPDRLHARFKPLRYTNAKAKRLLGWQPRYGLAEAIRRSAAAEAGTGQADR